MPGKAVALFYFYMLLKPKQNLIRDIVFVLFVFFALTIAKFHSWYLLNVLILIPLLEESLLKRLIVTLSLSHVFAITFLDQAKILNFLSMTLAPVIFVLFSSKNKKSIN